MTKRERKLTAYHEAGHAVMSRLLGKAFRRVTIKPDSHSGSLGHILHYKAIPAWVLRDAGGGLTSTAKADFWLKCEVLILLAGGVAERKIRGRDNDVGARSDRQTAIDLSEKMIGDLRSATAYVNYLFSVAENLLYHPRRWPLVEALANALLERETLTAREAAETDPMFIKSPQSKRLEGGQ